MSISLRDFRLAIAFMTVVPVEVSAAETRVPVLNVSTEQQEVFVQGSDNCNEPSKPDAPFRAIMRGENIVAYLSYIRNRVLTGSDLSNLKVSCEIALQGSENEDPRAHSDRDWIAAVWPLPGTPLRVGALIHDEYQPHRFPGRCRYSEYMQCWYNTITYAESDDGGLTFHHTDHVAIAPSFRADFEQGRHRGFFNPSNVVNFGGYNYVFVHTTGGGIQSSGVCLFRNDPADEPWDWRGWDGSDFSFRASDPYRTDYRGVERGCQPIAPFSSMVGSVVRTPSGTFIAIAVRWDREAPYFAYATSDDLFHWSALNKLSDVPTMWSKNCSDPYRYGYASLLPEQAVDRRFDLIARKGNLYMTRFHVADCKLSPVRDLIRFNVDLEEK